MIGPLAIRDAAPLPNPQEAIAQALARPIGSPPFADVARGRRNACILVCDVTRPVPNRLILPPLLRTLEEQGIARKDILILIATGLHRPNEGAELEEMLGPDIVAKYPFMPTLAKLLDTATPYPSLPFPECWEMVMEPAKFWNQAVAKELSPKEAATQANEAVKAILAKGGWSANA